MIRASLQLLAAFVVFSALSCHQMPDDGIETDQTIYLVDASQSTNSVLLRKFGELTQRDIDGLWPTWPVAPVDWNQDLSANSISVPDAWISDVRHYRIWATNDDTAVFVALMSGLAGLTEVKGPLTVNDQGCIVTLRE